MEKARIDRIKQILEEVGFKNPHPDLLYYLADSKLGIEESRKIKDFLSLKPYQSKGRIIVLEDASNLTLEAQNALLKTLEELPKNAIFILGIASDSKLLPTIVSRCQVEFLSIRYEQKTTNFYNEIEELLDFNFEERFEYIEKLKDRKEFFHELVKYFHKNLPDNTDFVKELLRAEEWANQNVNIRAILEYLMLVMPKGK